MIELGMYFLNDEVELPKFGTEMSACFDLQFCTLEPSVKGYDRYNQPIERFVHSRNVTINPGDRLLIPTGIIMKINKVASVETFLDINNHSENLNQFSIRLHARSGLALKRGLVLANAEGVIDVDYQNEVFVLMTNISEMTQEIQHKERIAQAEVVANKEIRITRLSTLPTQHSDRSGGFGSTGTL